MVVSSGCSPDFDFDGSANVRGAALRKFERAQETHPSHRRRTVHHISQGRKKPPRIAPYGLRDVSWRLDPRRFDPGSERVVFS